MIPMLLLQLPLVILYGTNQSTSLITNHKQLENMKYVKHRSSKRWKRNEWSNMNLLHVRGASIKIESGPKFTLLSIVYIVCTYVYMYAYHMLPILSEFLIDLIIQHEDHHSHGITAICV
jgi:hypothetical protein